MKLSHTYSDHIKLLPIRRRNLHVIDRPPLHLALYERLITSGHRTTDGNNADYYFIPITR
jgi:hypothetical protein